MVLFIWRWSTHATTTVTQLYTWIHGWQSLGDFSLEHFTRIAQLRKIIWTEKKINTAEPLTFSRITTSYWTYEPIRYFSIVRWCAYAVVIFPSFQRDLSVSYNTHEIWKRDQPKPCQSVLTLWSRTIAAERIVLHRSLLNLI